jgi:hypothetical protein
LCECDNDADDLDPANGVIEPETDRVCAIYNVRIEGRWEGRTFAGDVSKGMDVFDEEFGERVVDEGVLP